MSEKKRKAIVVVRVIHGEPAERAGIKAGDVLLAIRIGNAFVPFAGRPVDEVKKMIVDSPLARVELSIARGTREFTVIIEKTMSPMRSVYAYPLAQDAGITYADIADFTSRHLHEDLASALGAFNGGKLLIDLRGNPGGWLVEAEKCLALFAKHPHEILVTERTYGRSGSFEDVEEHVPSLYGAYAVGMFANERIAVLVDKNTASAAEILAGDLQQMGATIIGGKTYGKGTVQERFMLSHRHIMMLTVAEYLLGPSNKKVDGIGIMPDIVVPDPESDEAVKKAIEVLNAPAAR